MEQMKEITLNSTLLQKLFLFFHVTSRSYLQLHSLHVISCIVLLKNTFSVFLLAYIIIIFNGCTGVPLVYNL